MKRRIIEIDQDKCNGCGACAAACHEGAIAMVDGKARLMRDDYCDGLGDCLPTCPTGAITFVEREAAAYDEQAVMENKQRKMRKEGMTLPCGCPGSQSRNIQRQDAPAVETPQAQQTSRLSQWPVQIKLVPVNAPYFDGARLLIADAGDQNRLFVLREIELEETAETADRSEHLGPPRFGELLLDLVQQ